MCEDVQGGGEEKEATLVCVKTYKGAARESTCVRGLGWRR